MTTSTAGLRPDDPLDWLAHLAGERLPSHVFALMAHVAVLSDPRTLRCAPGVPELARRAGQHREDVREQLATAAAKGWIDLGPPTSRGRGATRPIRLTTPDLLTGSGTHRRHFPGGTGAQGDHIRGGTGAQGDHIQGQNWYPQAPHPGSESGAQGDQLRPPHTPPGVGEGEALPHTPPSGPSPRSVPGEAPLPLYAKQADRVLDAWAKADVRMKPVGYRYRQRVLRRLERWLAQGCPEAELIQVGTVNLPKGRIKSPLALVETRMPTDWTPDHPVSYVEAEATPGFEEGGGPAPSVPTAERSAEADAAVFEARNRLRVAQGYGAWSAS